MELRQRLAAYAATTRARAFVALTACIWATQATSQDQGPTPIDVPADPQPTPPPGLRTDVGLVPLAIQSDFLAAATALGVHPLIRDEKGEARRLRAFLLSVLLADVVFIGKVVDVTTTTRVDGKREELRTHLTLTVERFLRTRGGSTESVGLSPTTLLVEHDGLPNYMRDSPHLQLGRTYLVKARRDRGPTQQLIVLGAADYHPVIEGEFVDTGKLKISTQSLVEALGQEAD